jgi:hypothetical protein
MARQNLIVFFCVYPSVPVLAFATRKQQPVIVLETTRPELFNVRLLLGVISLASQGARVSFPYIGITQLAYAFPSLYIPDFRCSYA